MKQAETNSTSTFTLCKQGCNWEGRFPIPAQWQECSINLDALIKDAFLIIGQVLETCPPSYKLASQLQYNYNNSKKEMRNNDNDNPYILERYKAGGSNRFVCPQCGRKKCFTRYIDVTIGEYIADNCGKCDHTASCGYHYPPREYFRDHPDRKRCESYQPEYINGKPLVGMGKRRQSRRPPQTEFFPLSWAENSTERSNTFRSWFERLPFDQELIHQVLLEYFVGGTSYDIIIHGTNYGRAVIFWMIDEHLQVHDAKLMTYNGDGHRVGGWGNSMRSICEKTHHF